VNVKIFVAGTNPRANINQPVPKKWIVIFISRSHPYMKVIAVLLSMVASGFAEYPTEQFPVDDCQQTLHM
jgi:hypothetical protein